MKENRGKHLSILGSCYTTLDANLFEDAATLLPGFIALLIVISEFCLRTRLYLDNCAARIRLQALNSRDQTSPVLLNKVDIH